MTTPKARDWRTNPRTEAEWDWYCVHKAPQFTQCLWLAVHMPSKLLHTNKSPIDDTRTQ